MSSTIDDVKASLKKMDESLEEGSETWDVALALISSMVVGPNIERICQFSSLPRETVQKVSFNCRKNGIWKRNKIYANWLDEEDGGISFWTDVCCAQGYMERC